MSCRMVNGKISITFRLGQPPKYDGKTRDFLAHFESDLQLANLRQVQELISQSDIGVSQTLDSGQEVKWNFTIKNEKLKTRRFVKFASMLFRDKQHDKALYNYQKDGISWLRKNPKCILADDMGLGKTLQVIKACEYEIFEHKKQLILIFCPNALASNWLRELNKWFSLASAEQYHADQLSRLANSVNFVIVSYPQMSNFLLEYEKLTLHNGTIAVFDEAHKLRNEGAQISRLSKYFDTSVKWLLTGTPLERDQKDIATILNILDPGLHVGKLKNDEFLMKSRFQNLTLRRTKDLALKELPPVTKHFHHVEMSKQQTDEYKALLKEYKGRPKTEQIGVLTKLMITASDQKVGLSPKFLAALETLDEKIKKGEKSIIFSRFNNILEKFSSALNTKGIGNVLVNGKLSKEDQDLRIKRFQSDENCHVLVINLSIGSEGLTLTEANNVLFLNEAWNPSMNRQAEDRVNRIGQHKHVEIHVFRTKNSIDVNLEEILLRKGKLENEYIALLVEDIFQ
jgi:SNF2 family DNA or RNA helicase